VQTLSLQTGAGGDSITEGTTDGKLFSSPKVVVDGGGGSNTFTADDSGQVGFFGGLPYTVSATQVTNDAVGLAATYGNIQFLTLKTSTGDDFVTVTGAGNKLFSIPQVTVDAGFGTNNALTADDSGNTAGAAYTVSDNQLTASGPVIKYTGMDAVTLKSGAGNDAVTISNPGGALFSLPRFVINAGGGTSNTLTVNDSGETFNGLEYDVSEKMIDLPNSLGAIVTYPGIQNLTVLTGSGDDAFLVSGSDHTLSKLPKVTIGGGGGGNSLTVDDSGASTGDTFQISGGAITLPNTLGTVVTYIENGSNFMPHVALETGSGNDAVTVFGYSGGLGTDLTVEDWGASAGDSLTLDNTADLAGGTYAITSGSIVPPGPVVPVSESGFESLALKTGLVQNEGSVVNIESTPAGGSLSVTGGNGNDTLVAGGTTGRLDGIQEPVALNGGAGTDAVIVNDANSSTNNVYVGSPTAVSKLGGPVVSYSAVEAVTVNGGSGRDLMIAGTGKMKLVGGGGEDILIGGHTNFDTDATALNALMAEWTRTDEVYQQRVRHITRGGGLNGSTKLNPATVHGNGGGNTLLGGSADKDLFFGSKTLDTTDWNPSTESFYSV
jgi:hypothetical protein